MTGPRLGSLGLALMVVVAWGAVLAAPISLGLRTQDWYFMWAGGNSMEERAGLNADQEMKWALARATLDRYGEFGAEWNILILRQDRDGPDGFARADRAVAEYAKRGIRAVLRLIERPGVYGELHEKPLAEKGYHKAYFDWVKAIASRYGERVSYYLISNEVDHDIGYNRPVYRPQQVDFEDYRKLLNTANLAVKTVSPDLQVVDHGLSGYTLGLAVADQLVREGQPLAAYRFWKNFHYGRLAGWDALVDLVRALYGDDGRRRIRVARDTFMALRDCDAHQIHYYGGWRALPAVIDWARARMEEAGVRRPLMATEVGYITPSKPGKTWDGRDRQVADMGRYSPQEHAENLFKDFAILLGLGVDRVLYWQARWHDDRQPNVPLFEGTHEPETFRPRLAALVYRNLAHVLTGRVPAPNPFPSTQDLWGFSFTDRSIVSILWADRDQVLLDLTGLPDVERVTDLVGRTLHVSGSELVVGDAPILIFWSNPRGVPSGDV